MARTRLTQASTNGGSGAARVLHAPASRTHMQSRRESLIAGKHTLRCRRMPDWTYHPFFKPLLFRLPPEDARALTLALLAMQAKTVVGRRVFRLFGHGPPPPEVAVQAMGLTFPAPVGLAPGIEIDGSAVPVMQHLGFGFV